MDNELLSVGARVEIVTGPMTGETATVTNNYGIDPYFPYALRGDNLVLTGKWSNDALVLIEESGTDIDLPIGARAPSRPTVDFSGTSRETARKYAAEADSRVLDNPRRSVLQEAAAGRKDVDALELNKAVMAAMRSATTRKGTSIQRREQARHFAHLGHIAQAVLESAVDQQPAFDSTAARSKVVKELKTNLEALQADHGRYYDESEDRIRQLEATLSEFHTTLLDQQAAEMRLRSALDYASGSDFDLGVAINGFLAGYDKGVEA